MPFDLDRAVRSLTQWTAIESPTRHVPGLNAMMNLVFSEAASAGIAAERLAGRDGLGDMVILRAGPNNGEKPILVLSHLDTVHPVGTKERDLVIRVEGDRLYGPGIYDMKGGAWLAFEAFRQAAANGKVQRPLVYLFTPDEEIGSPISRPVIEALASQAAYVLVTEPAREGGKCVTGRKGVGRFDIHVEGRPAHSGSRHPDGRSAIREAARLVLQIEAMTDYASGVTTTVGMIEGGTAANVIPQKCWFCADLRVVTEADGRLYAEKILGLTAFNPDVTVTVTGGMNRPPMERKPDIAALYDHARAQAEKLGIALGEVPLTGGGSDGNFTAALGVPTLDGLGIDGDGAHTLQEYGLLSSVEPRMRLMRALLETL